MESFRDRRFAIALVVLLLKLGSLLNLAIKTGAKASAEGSCLIMGAIHHSARIILAFGLAKGRSCK